LRWRMVLRLTACECQVSVQIAKRRLHVQGVKVNACLRGPFDADRPSCGEHDDFYAGRTISSLTIETYPRYTSGILYAVIPKYRIKPGGFWIPWAAGESPCHRGRRAATAVVCANARTLRGSWHPVCSFLPCVPGLPAAFSCAKSRQQEAPHHP
jgi:hypothetical protein